MTVNSYDPIARVYDVLWGPVSVTRYLPAIADWLSHAIAPGARVLDVACGAGQVVAAMIERGYRAAGVDAAPAMIDIARRRAPTAELSVAQFGLLPFADSEFAATLCLFDSLNHVAPDQLATVISDLARVIAPGGLLVFDVNTEDGFRQRWRGDSVEVRDDLVCITRARYNTEYQIGDYLITAFEPTNSGQWSRADAHLREYVHPDAAIRAALAAAHMIDVDTLASDVDLGFTRDVGRVFYRARKDAGP